MSLTGIIAEFNPLHNGHEYLIKTAKKSGPVVCALSGNLVQRGETAIAEKRIRAKAALLAGADLVLELPVLWSMSTAQSFALGGVSILNSIGCDKILFGSECGEAKPLKAAAEILEGRAFQELLAKELKGGVTFAKARQNAAEKCGVLPEILSGANNNLAIEYITAAKKLNADITFETVKRQGADHDSLKEDDFVSATLLREKLKQGDREFCKKYMPEYVLPLFAEECISDMDRLDRAILAVLRTKTPEELSRLPDLSEGIENKLFSAIRLAENVDSLYNGIKVKRYTLARVRRLVLSAFIGADDECFMKTPPYIRVLGFNKAGERILREISALSPIPIVTRVSEIKNLSAVAQKVFATECRATDLFSLSLPKPAECGLEYTAKIIKTE